MLLSDQWSWALQKRISAQQLCVVEDGSVWDPVYPGYVQQFANTGSASLYTCHIKYTSEWAGQQSVCVETESASTSTECCTGFGSSASEFFIDEDSSGDGVA